MFQSVYFYSVERHQGGCVLQLLSWIMLFEDGTDTLGGTSGRARGVQTAFWVRWESWESFCVAGIRCVHSTSTLEKDQGGVVLFAARCRVNPEER